MNRSDFLQVLEAALTAKQPAYARTAAEQHLAEWPGDLAVRAILGRALAAENDLPGAVEALTAVTSADPEDYAAHRALAEVTAAAGAAEASALALACAYVGRAASLTRAQRANLPKWAEASRAAYRAQHVGDWNTALKESLAALKDDPPPALVSLLHLKSLWQAGHMDLARPLAEGFHSRWPAVVAFRLCLAECLIAGGESLRAIELLHEAAAQDVGAQVVGRYWGSQHPYRSLWPVDFSPSLPGPLPATIALALGRNQLDGTEAAGQKARAARSAAKTSALPEAPEDLADIQAELDKIAARLPSKEVLKYRLRRLKQAANGQAPTGQPPQPYYVVVSSRTRLIQQYGDAGFDALHAALLGLLLATRRRTGYQTALVYVDDPTTLSPFGLRPVNPTNAWDIKTLIGRLAERLRTQNGSLNALLIVGGPNIIPFHHLPNPTDDADPDIPSDNPYATPDENYFVPEWAVGRLPSGEGSDPGPLLRAIRHAAGTSAQNGPAYRAWLERLRQWIRRLWLERVGSHSFGYSANVWRRASQAVFNLIGDPRELYTSPPLDANALPIEGLAPSRLSYFNLHGIEDGPDWYGQRSPDDPGSVPEYPVALRPMDVVNSGRAPVVVFSEACFGANVLGKTVEDALCLKFLDSGTRILVGSTKIAYGSVTTPLIGADLLGRCFWQNLNLGLPAGEALRRAKLHMAQEMHQRQGFLDGEDQKTLISFVLYGDPLAVAPVKAGDARAAAKPLPAARLAEPLRTVCDKPDGAEPAAEDLSPEAVAQIKSVVAQYLPGMDDAAWRVARGHSHCSGVGHKCPTAQLGKSSKARPASGKNGETSTTVVTLAKTIRASAHTHPHYARVTLDAKGAVIKVAVSR